MRVLITIQPGSGHLFPLLPLAGALERAGHTVAFVCSPSFVPRVEGAGFQALAAGLDWLESEPEATFPEMATLSPAERDAMLTEIFTDISAGQMAHDLLAICDGWSPDLLVRDSAEYGACLVGELRGIPHAAVGMGLYIPDYIAGLVMEKPLAYLRSALGLPPQPALEMLTKYLYLTFLPPTLQYPEYPLPPATCALQPTDPFANREADLPAWVATLPDRPTLYASMGTVFNRVPAIFRAILEGLAEEPVNLIMTVGYNQDPAAFGPLPNNVHIEQFIPQHLLMPYCDAVITHGGINTVVTALSHGLPTVLVPLAGHQWQNVARCLALGAGLALRLPEAEGDGTGVAAEQNAAFTLYAEESPYLTAETVRAAVKEVVERDSYRGAARAIQAEIQSLPKVDYGVQLLERLAQERTPLIAGEVAG